jgi:hypothetical protein
MEKTRITNKAEELKKSVPSMLRDRSADLLQSASQIRDRQMPVVVTTPRRPMWQTAGMWFAGGMAIAAALGYFFDRRQGSMRRHMAYDKTLAAGRAVQQWSGKKARHLRNRAMGTVAEMKGAHDEMEPNPPSQRELG